ncbi:hypothetical protein SS1G_11018 [Sclerotinia sclerotiorum 1980 UF-70]|uniref:NADH-ubiquinone oxidoreductase 213 kDa subunit n=1 Tax=Sclerotinia sclerotiorum (strain ATCC 18683 / 1980 / Ss-1) TaxID=665079 RepID=A7F0A1_SCLS1|nr:hypothetical protein SS1G_11018 [Sclerotinia sclerotiorum 1980 UF-70]EDN95143.1 hypothetical protein SS1G_11018 [Sclerotinia sclerotiorum 1980 UF-70]
MAPNSDVYHPQDALKAGINGALISGSAGAFASAIQNTLHKKNIGALGFITRTGSTAFIMTAIGGTYEFTKYASANLREKNDTYNTAIGVGTTPAVLGFGTLAAVVLSAFDYTGGALSGYKRDPNVDEFERKEHLRKNRRIPIEQTVAELGEGRGYDERRRERIKERYGIDVPARS